MAKAFSRKQESPFWGHPHARKLHGLVPFSAKAFSRKQESPFWGHPHSRKLHSLVPKVAKAFFRKQESPFWGHPHSRKLHSLVPKVAKAFFRKQESPFLRLYHDDYAIFYIMVSFLFSAYFFIYQHICSRNFCSKKVPQIT
jgi:hypothetical protein